MANRNPAQLLLELFRKWKSSTGGTPSAQREIEDAFSPGWNDVLRAFKYISEIERLLEELRGTGANVQVYQRYIPAWTAAAASWPRGWDKQGHSEFNQTLLDHLETLSGRLDETVPTFTEDGLEAVGAFVSDAAALLNEDQSIPKDLRDHLTGVLLHVQRCVSEYDLTGDYAAARAIDELLATLGRVQNASSEPGKWKTLLNGLVYPFASSAAANIATNPALLQLIPGIG
ncbi:peptidase [Gordonia phage Vasanti]|uniref:Peptidase n=1 Tax=Gordonia phage Vasanti TaxID=2502431 RepID=A0A411BVZ7_9CAUD|nr:peptidase [Gordonia phage Vasanti]QAY05778.1 peptidase [Gordonia phage Vasanti]